MEALVPHLAEAAAGWAARLNLPQSGEADFALQLGEAGLQLAELGPQAPGPVRVDFVEGAVAHRRVFGGGSGQMIAKAVGVQPGVRPRVLDATAGLGRDGFVLASLGCAVTLIERQPLIAALLEDGLARARGDREVGPIVAQMQLLTGNAIELMDAWEGEPPQVIYLDPMFPHRDKSALVKKEMRLFRPWTHRPCSPPPWPWPATGWWSNARAKHRSSPAPRRAMRWRANPAATTSIPRKSCRLEVVNAAASVARMQSGRWRFLDCIQATCWVS
jgi:16S rRNA (guanine1516-N2)-methyltransferase